MSKVDDLIRELSPKSVPRLQLDELVTIEKGSHLSDGDFQPGAFPVVTASRSESRRHAFSNVGPKSITITSHGAYAGHVNFWEDPIWLAGNVFLLKPNLHMISQKFLFYLLKHNQEVIQGKARGGGIPYINTSDLRGLWFPLPPLEVQKEIVSILDKFTKLEAELEAELEARKRQFSYLCDKVFSHTYAEEKRFVTSTLGEEGLFQKGSGLQKSDFREAGMPCIHYGQIHTTLGAVSLEAMSRIEKVLFEKLRKAQPGNLIIADTAEDVEGVAKSTAWLGDEDVAVGGHTLIYTHGFDPRYISYFTRSSYFQMQKNALAKGVKVKDISAKAMSKISVPVPPLETQREIGEALSQLDALINNISIGLPAEIAARRKQYEYYRNKLLTFKELDAA